ncbi:unnamed protein product, partial [Symbiodinium natans]
MRGVIPLPQGVATTAWPGAQNFNGSIYCAYEDAIYEILYEFASVNLQDNTGEIFIGPALFVNTSQTPTVNGGLNCPSATPFPEVTTSTTTSTTTLPPPLQSCNTTAWNCSNSSSFSTLALQMINEQIDGNCIRGTIQALDVTTGTYVPICQFEGECFNACGVNPLDNYIYCMTEEPSNTGYIARLTCPTIPFFSDAGPSSAAGSICYIGTQRSSVSAGFSLDGRYVFIADEGGLFFQDGLDMLPAYDRRPIASDNVSFDLRPLAQNVTNPGQTEQINGFDLTVREVDLGNQTGDQNFTISCNDNYVMFQSLEVPTNFFNLTMVGSRPRGISGAQWEFQGRVFCAYNDFGEVFEVEVDTANLASQTVVAGFVNNSAQVFSNDGLNCLTAPTPFPDP